MVFSGTYFLDDESADPARDPQHFVPLTGFGLDITAGTFTTETFDDLILVPNSCTQGNLFVANQNPPGTGASWTFNLRLGTSLATITDNPAVTCTISNTATTCNVTSLTLPITAGDVIDLKMTPSTTTVPSDGQMTASFSCK
jgi:hypothetical protein